tara:strand:- start:6 stop:191 length:186 start_codon:yes stop_codon:yes gene_type:complete
MSTKRYYATYNPNHENKFTTHRCFSGEKEAEGSRDLPTYPPMKPNYSGAKSTDSPMDQLAE